MGYSLHQNQQAIAQQRYHCHSMQAQRAIVVPDNIVGVWCVCYMPVYSWEDDASVGSGNECPSPASLARQASLPQTQSYVYKGAGLSVSDAAAALHPPPVSSALAVRFGDSSWHCIG